MKNFFKPEDFKQFLGMGLCQNEIAFYCNEKLNKLIESWPVVYGCIPPGETEFYWHSVRISKDTHTARLAFIEEIKKEPCKHEPNEYKTYMNETTCQHCGVKLQATWSEKK